MRQSLAKKKPDLSKPRNTQFIDLRAKLTAEPHAFTDLSKLWLPLPASGQPEGWQMVPKFRSHLVTLELHLSTPSLGIALSPNRGIIKSHIALPSMKKEPLFLSSAVKPLCREWLPSMLRSWIAGCASLLFPTHFQLVPRPSSLSFRWDSSAILFCPASLLRNYQRLSLSREAVVFSLSSASIFN